MRDTPERDLAVAQELGHMANARIKELERERDALREALRDVAAALKETAFSYHVEAEHKPAFATCTNVMCVQACRTWNRLVAERRALGESI